MSPLFLLLVTLAALATPSQAQNDVQHYCGLPYPAVASPGGRSQPTRSRRQAQSSPSNVPPQGTPSVPYSSCGAVVIHDNFLLTAANCVFDRSRPLNSVRLGDLDLSQDGEANSRPADYDIELIIVHPNFTYSPDTQIRYSDLALLKTARKIEFNEVVYPYCISRDPPVPGTTVTASGFGYVNSTHKPTHLQEGELQVMALSECEAEYRAKGKEKLLRRAYPGLLQGSGVVCAGKTDGGVCRGDEGGPLMSVDESGRRYLYGILSFTGDVCGPGILPSVSVSVADHYDFIVNTIQSA